MIRAGPSPTDFSLPEGAESEAAGRGGTFRVTGTTPESTLCLVRVRRPGPGCEKHARRLVQDATGDVRLSAHWAGVA